MLWIRSWCKLRLSELVQWYTGCCSAGNVSIVVHDDIVFMFLDARDPGNQRTENHSVYRSIRDALGHV